MILNNQRKIAVKILHQEGENGIIALVVGYSPHLNYGEAWEIFEARKYSATESAINRIEEGIKSIPRNTTSFSGYRIETCKDDHSKIIISFTYTSNHSGK
jgi:hypothetical protein